MKNMRIVILIVVLSVVLSAVALAAHKGANGDLTNLTANATITVQQWIDAGITQTPPNLYTKTLVISDYDQTVSSTPSNYPVFTVISLGSNATSVKVSVSATFDKPAIESHLTLFQYRAYQTSSTSVPETGWLNIGYGTTQAQKGTLETYHYSSVYNGQSTLYYYFALRVRVDKTTPAGIYKTTLYISLYHTVDW